MNEKAIVKRMKAAAKAAGCKIWRNEHDVLVLCGGGWCFVCEWGNCPPAVLGCLAEWLHGLPCPGSGYWYKGYPDPEPLDCQPPELAALIGRSEEDLILSPLRTETLQLAQTRTGQMYWFSTDLTAMLGTLATTGGGTLLPAKDETQMPWGRWGREGRLLFLETENCVAPATTSKLEALDCWEEDRL